ncbi:MAG TPA: TetR family transcriptional regulator [Pseudonocardia sp.]|nr:TetR family transcriptional regulator [Pseudonocardia sp.]
MGSTDTGTDTGTDRQLDETARPARRRGDRRTTRQRLLTTAVRLLREEGEAAVSTTRLTQEVGIVQSGFYSHFPSVEACLAEAAAVVVAEVRNPVRQWMDELHHQESDEPALVLERTVAHFVQVLGIIEPRRAFLDLMERYRRAPGSLGEALAALHAELVGDVRDYLVRLWRQEDLPTASPQAERIRLVADLIVAMAVSAAAALGDDRGLRREDAARALAVGVNAVVGDAMESARGSGSVTGPG